MSKECSHHKQHAYALPVAAIPKICAGLTSNQYLNLLHHELGSTEQPGELEINLVPCDAV